jgi:hypothetical protein
MSKSVFTSAYVLAACRCTPLRMCGFCKKWTKPQPPPPARKRGRTKREGLTRDR